MFGCMQSIQNVVYYLTVAGHENVCYKLSQHEELCQSNLSISFTCRRIIEDAGLQGATPEQCREKWLNLLKKYKVINTSSSSADHCQMNL